MRDATLLRASYPATGELHDGGAMGHWRVGPGSCGQHRTRGNSHSEAEVAPVLVQAHDGRRSLQ